MLLLLSTLGDYFPDVWEGKNEIKTAKFKSCFEGAKGKRIVRAFNKNYSAENPLYALARYCPYGEKSAQKYNPSILEIYEMREKPDSLYDIELVYSVHKKVNDSKFIDTISNINSGGKLMFEITSQILKEKFKDLIVD